MHKKDSEAFQDINSSVDLEEGRASEKQEVDKKSQNQRKYGMHEIELERKVLISILLALLAGIIIILFKYPNKKMAIYQQAPLIANIEKVNIIKDLPFCLLITNLNNRELDIKQSLNKVNYQNFVSIVLEKQLPISQAYKYSKHRQLIDKKCPQYSVIMYLNNPVEPSIIKKLNQIHQKYDAWATYSFENTYQVVSFYWRIYELLETNDFEKSNKKYLEEGNFEVYASGILQLSQLHLKRITELHQRSSPIFISPLKVDFEKGTLFDRKKYTKLYKLSQDFEVDLKTEQERITNFKTIGDSIYGGITKRQLIDAVYRQQLMYLPENHSIVQLQKVTFSQVSAKNRQKFEIQQKNETKFCVTVLSNNNIHQNRYKKVLLSIFQQKYQNYHVIFIDDNSIDQNLQKSIEFTKNFKFPSSKITFIKNNQRMYATFNIVNAAFNYCNDTDVQLLIDGDDQIIGRYAFAALNQVYFSNKQKNKEKWLVYSNYKSNLYTYGTSKKYFSINEILIDGKRRSARFIGPIRTWRVQLIRNIPLQYHQFANKTWLDTVYDDALQHCLLEQTGVENAEYLQQILYEYNKQHGNNDDSTVEKKDHRYYAYMHILNLEPMKRVQSFQTAKKNQNVVEQLKKFENISRVIKLSW